MGAVFSVDRATALLVSITILATGIFYVVRAMFSDKKRSCKHASLREGGVLCVVRAACI
jgi:hypothetical protein